MACNCNPCPCQRGRSWWTLYVNPELPATHSMPPEAIVLLRNATMTQKEIYDQRVSFIYGQLMDAAPNVTKDEIKRHLAEMGVIEPT